MEHTALFLSCPQDFSAPPNLWCVQVSLIFSVILSASSCLYGLYLTKEQHPGVFLAISVLLAGHLLFSKSLAKEQRRPAAPCEREREREAGGEHIKAAPALWSLSETDTRRAAGPAKSLDHEESLLVSQV